MLDQFVQLHEQIEIHYYVSHYEAQLYTQDGHKKVLVGRGDTIMDAIFDLCWAVRESKVKNIDELRSLPRRVE